MAFLYLRLGSPIWARSLAVALAGLLVFPEAPRNLFPCLCITGTLLIAIDVPFSQTPVINHLDDSPQAESTHSGSPRLRFLPKTVYQRWQTGQ